jgi:amino acid adenylation domain-containing protein
MEILSPAERHRLIVAWNATEVDYPRDKCIHELFEKQAGERPEAIAVVCEGIELSYGQLNIKANQLAHYLRSLGVGPDALVAICAERSVEMVVALLAILKAGGAYVPLDPAYPAERLTYMLQDSAPVAVLTHGMVDESVRIRLASGLNSNSTMIDLGGDAWRWQDTSETNPRASGIGLTPEHLVYMIYTSGSTGMPKGVMNEHRGVVNRLQWMQNTYALDTNDAVLQKTPFSFDVSVWEFFWPLLNGAKLVMARPEGHKDTDYLTAVIRQHQITTLHFVPSMLQVFLEHAEVGQCLSLVRVICSGEALPGSLARRFQQRLPGVGLHNLYGPTEAAVDVTAWACTGEKLADNIPIGRPIANTQIYILDAHGQPAPAGVAGELHIGGVQVARGYLNRPELTAERFIPDPFANEPGARMYKTGDLARWLPDGTIVYMGRNDLPGQDSRFPYRVG